MNWFDERDSNKGSNDAFEGYQKGTGAVLDHLVPINERVEDAPALLLQDEQDVNHEELACVKDAWQKATERAIEAQELWGPRVLSRFDECFAQVVEEQTPSAEDAQKRREILQQIDELVQTGLPDYPGLCIRPYGSYVSGLYCPSGDLDLSIEGTPTGGPALGKPVKSIGKGGKADLLRTLSKRLERTRLHSGWVERILHARVPILKFTCKGVDCDVSIGSSNAIFKAKTFRALAAREPRFADMLRLVKAWAGAHRLNDASDGTFNSFALGLMVIFHMQTCEPAVLPPLHELFEDGCGAIASRPIHMGQDITWDKLEVFERCAAGYEASQNRQGLAQLMAGFFSRFHAALLMWRDGEQAACVRASTWCGKWSFGHWEKSYVAAVEDPFDATDNCARTIGFSRIDTIVEAFGRAAAVMNTVRDDAGIQTAMGFLFKGVVPLGMPPVPVVELKQGRSTKKEKMLAQEAKRLRWRQQLYARDNRILMVPREKGRGPGQPDRAAGSPAGSTGGRPSRGGGTTPLRVPKFAQQMQAQGAASLPSSGLLRSFMAHEASASPPVHLTSGSSPANNSFAQHNSSLLYSPSSSLTALAAGQYHSSPLGPAQSHPGSMSGSATLGPPAQRPASSLGSAHRPAELPSTTLAASSAAQLARGSLLFGRSSEPPRAHPGLGAAQARHETGQGVGQAMRRGPPGFVAASGNPHAGSSLAAGNAMGMPSGEYIHASANAHMHDGLSAAGAGGAAQHSPPVPLPYYRTQTQQANQALSDELKRVLKIGQVPAASTPPLPASVNLNGANDSTSGIIAAGNEGSPVTSVLTGKPRRKWQPRRPEKQPGEPAAQAPGTSRATPAQGQAPSAAAANSAGPFSHPLEQSRKPKVRKQANSQGRPARASVPVKSAAEAFLENDLSTGVQRRKPKKAVAVAAR